MHAFKVPPVFIFIVYHLCFLGHTCRQEEYGEYEDEYVALLVTRVCM